jgi:hypothetical protein
MSTRRATLRRATLRRATCRTIFSAAMLAAALAMAPAGAAAPAPGSGGADNGKDAGAFQFGVIAHSFKSATDDSILQAAIRETDRADLAFVVATGIKSAAESCNDKLYNQRRKVLDDSTRPLVVSLAASDWSDCKNSLGRSVAIERLNRLREVFFPDDLSLGARKLPLFRLSSAAKFRGYAENAHWESGQVLFATVNWPANNNHFLPEAGRNSEFEDRLVANRAWLKRLFSMAARKKLEGIVLFSDGNVGLQAEDSRALSSRLNGRQDGFAETRRQVKALAQKFPGQVLMVDTQSASPGPAQIAWHDNLGHLSVTSGWAEIHVGAAGATELFTLKGGGATDSAPR